MSAHIDLDIPHWKERTLEVLPGLLSWGFMISIIVFSFFAIEVVAYVIVGFAFLWLIKIFGYSRRLVHGYRLMRTLQDFDWNKHLSDLKDVPAALKRVEKKLREGKTLDRPALQRYQYLLNRSFRNNDILDPDEVLHAVIIPTHNEAKEITRATIQAVANNNYDSKKIMFVLSYEERGGAEVEQSSKELAKEFKDTFKEFWAVKHPKDIPGEAKAKAGNATFAARKVTAYAKKHKIDPANIIVTTLDADNRPASTYLAYLTFIYCVSQDRVKKSYQPMAMFFNNIWDAPAITRVIATNNSFWLLMEAMRPQRLRNFSSHAQSLQALIDTDYWNVKSIVEDGHQYWRTYFRYDGNHTVVPLYVAIYQDAVLAGTLWQTMREQFTQLRRWAWGVSDTPYVIVKMYRDRQIAWGKKAVQLFRQIEGYFSWATAPIILAFASFAPIFINPSASDSIVAQQLPLIVSRVNTVALIGLVGPVVATMMALPPRPPHVKITRRIGMVLQWVLIPVALICFGSVAALNAQTRLMFGKYLETFDATVKKRKDKPTEASF